MGQTKKSLPHNIDLFFISENELDQLLHNDEFKEILIKESYKAILKSIRRKTLKATIVTINNLGVSINVDKKDFKPILEKAIKYFEIDENYNECSKIIKLIKKLS
jgi:hypothetical protein